MSSKKLSGLSAATDIADADLFYTVQSGVSRKATGAQIKAYANSNVTLDGLSDVNTGPPDNGDVLTWDAVGGEWIASASGASGGSVPNGGTTGQILRKLSGVDQDVGWIGNRGCLVYSSGQSALNATSDSALLFANESYDTDSLHDNSTNNSRIIIPSGVTKARLSGGVLFQNVAANAEVLVYIRKNGSSAAYAGIPHCMCDTSFTFPRANVVTPVIPVAPADYFELVVQCSADNSIDILATYTWFGCEVIE